MPKTKTRLLALAAILATVVALAGCAGQESTNDQGNGNDGDEVNNDTLGNDSLNDSTNETGNMSMDESLYSPP
ncbi:MAG TPA: hypothetical protein VHH36_03660 [Candidatus Thermoplasmatota archaeon]|nr:hypothetical protein [Candidatus Thermoplasmatota archaeon]